MGARKLSPVPPSPPEEEEEEEELVELGLWTKTGIVTGLFCELAGMLIGAGVGS